MGVTMAKTLAGGSLGKWHWLRTHPRRVELLALVTGTPARVTTRGAGPAGSLTAADLTGYGLTDAQAALVCWDALGVRARLAGQSWRSIAETVEPERSYETWRTVYKLYTEYSDALFAAAPGLKLARIARERITERVLRDWLAGRTDTGDVAKILGERVSAKHALYWLRRRARHLGISGEGK
jgi:hypothetical protein